jgi:hypothetical protein
MAKDFEALHAKKDAALNELCAAHAAYTARQVNVDVELILQRNDALAKVFRALLALDWDRGLSKAERAHILKNIRDVEAIEAAERAA